MSSFDDCGIWAMKGGVQIRAEALRGRLIVVLANQRIQDQLRASGVSDVIGAGGVYAGDDRVGAALERPWADSAAWIDDQQQRVGAQR